MPRKFRECVRKGGRVRTKTWDNKYMPICFIDNKSYPGEVHTKKKKKQRKK